MEALDYGLMLAQRLAYLQAWADGYAAAGGDPATPHAIRLAETDCARRDEEQRQET